jgi:flavin-dependent dehydrogenase
MTEADVVIVGGGPAGCSCAIGLRQRGLSVVVVSSPGKAKTPTETAAPQLGQMLVAMGATNALIACEPCYGISSAWGRSGQAIAPSIFDPHGNAWFVHREKFDSELGKSARSTGAKWTEALAEDVIYEGSDLLLSTTNGPIRARWLVIATGASNWGVRFTKQQRTTYDNMLALWTILDTTLEARLLFSEPSDYGWWYLCPHQMSRAMVCLVTDAKAARTLGLAEPRKWMQGFSSTKLFAELKFPQGIESVQAATIGFSFLKARHGNCWIAIGDAAAKLDPLGSCGTMTALDSGRRAAIAIADQLRGDASGMGAYASWSGGLIREFKRQRERQYSLEQSKRDDGFWTRRFVKSAGSASTN